MNDYGTCDGPRDGEEKGRPFHFQYFTSHPMRLLSNTKSAGARAESPRRIAGARFEEFVPSLVRARTVQTPKPLYQIGGR